MKKVYLTIIIAMIFLLSACNESYRNFNTDVDEAEYKLKKSLEIQNVEAAKEAIEEGVDVNCFTDRRLRERTDHGKLESNPLRIAIFTGCYGVAELLLESGADPNYEDADGVSLIQAASKRKEQFIINLIEAGADINNICGNGKTALEYSIANQRWDAVKLILSYEPDIRKETVDELVNLYDNNADDLWRGFDVIKELLQLPEFKDCKLNNLFLQNDMESGSLINLDITAAFGTLEEMAEVLKTTSEYDLNHLCECAARYGNIDVLGYIADIYSDRNITELFEQPLCIAAEYDDIKTAEFILNREVNIPLGKAAEVAAKSNAQNVMKKLIEFGLNPNEPVNFNSLLKTACFYGNLPIVKLLTENGANVDGINNGEPLSIASERGYTDIVIYLIQNGANVNGDNIHSDGSGGDSVLMCAIIGGQLECVKLLVENGADVHYVCTTYDNSYSVLEVAKQEESDRIYQYLLEVS